MIQPVHAYLKQQRYWYLPPPSPFPLLPPVLVSHQMLQKECVLVSHRMLQKDKQPYSECLRNRSTSETVVMELINMAQTMKSCATWMVTEHKSIYPFDCEDRPKLRTHRH
jgi:hypothetical protein